MRLSGVSIKYKLSLLFLALILAPFAVYTTIIIHESSQYAERVSRHSARQLLLQAGQFIESRVGLVRRLLLFTSLDADIRRLADVDSATYGADVSQWIIDASKLQQVMLTVRQSDPDMVGFALYMSRGVAAFSPSRDLKPLDPETRNDWYRKMLARNANTTWFPSRYFASPDGEATVHGVARVTNDMDLTKTVGFVRIDVPERIFSGILNQSRFSPASLAFLTNAAGETIATSDGAETPLEPLLAAARSSFSPAADEAVAPKTVIVNGRKYLIDCLYVKDTDWRLLALSPYEDIDAFGQTVRWRMLVALAVLVPLMLPLAFWVASRSTRRIGCLTAGVRELERGNLSVRLAVESRDEIGALTEDFNRMASRLAWLLEERYRLGQEMKHLEMRALQAQINPHFLYNTLDLVNCLSLKLKVPLIGTAVEALSKFYRLSLSGGAETVSIQQELEHVETYVRIQNMRFDDGITLRIDVPPSIRALLILKIVLQPLVENAVLHGIREKESGLGTITIGATRQSAPTASDVDIVIITITDDGVGMDPKCAAEIMRQDTSGEGHGYGIRNIDRRLKVKYGPSYGLSYRGVPEQGTRVTIRMPACECGTDATTATRSDA